MPTVARFDGLRVVIYPNDHEPEHVHVIGGGCEAVFLLHCPWGLPERREVYGFTDGQVAQIRRKLARMIRDLYGAWERIHG